MLSPGEIDKLKKAGFDIHDLKLNSKYDLYKDRDGKIWVKPKGGGKMCGDSTGLNITDY